MPRTMEVAVFKIDELNDNAKHYAMAQYAYDLWDSEDWWASAQAFGEIAPISIDSADYVLGLVDVSWTGQIGVDELTGLRAWKWLQNNGWFDWAKENAKGACTMTGFAGDCPFADVLIYYRDHPLKIQDLEQVFYEMAQAWVFAARRDNEATQSDEYIAEYFNANDYEFFENGRIVG